MTGKRDRRTTFDQAADSYYSARPSYPRELVEDLVSLAELPADARLLEIGCGPGTATVPLAQRGYRITALEPGPRLADEARRNLAGFPGVEVVTTSFEDWLPDGGDKFDLVYSASAWHWVDPRVRWAKAAEVLNPCGRLAVFGASHAFPVGYDPIFDDIQRVYVEIGESDVQQWPPTPPRTDSALPTGDYEGSDYFALLAVRRYLWSQQYTADSFIALLNTFSGHIAMEAGKRERLYDSIRRLLAERPDGELTRHWWSGMSIARRLP